MNDQEKLQHLLDRAEISDVIYRYADRRGQAGR